jgi:hypothetical protein
VALSKLARREEPGRLAHYAEVIGEDGRWNGEMRLLPEGLDDPTRWREPRTVFVNSMSDLFHENMPVDDVRKVCEAMARADHHTYQVLTKRAERMRELLTGPLRDFAELPQVWWGTSVENRRHGLPRIEHLRRMPAAVRFLSVEPLGQESHLAFRRARERLLAQWGEPGPGPVPQDAVHKLKCIRCEQLWKYHSKPSHATDRTCPFCFKTRQEAEDATEFLTYWMEPPTGPRTAVQRRPKKAQQKKP